MKIFQVNLWVQLSQIQHGRINKCKYEDATLMQNISNNKQISQSFANSLDAVESHGPQRFQVTKGCVASFGRHGLHSPQAMLLQCWWLLDPGLCHLSHETSACFCSRIQVEKSWKESGELWVGIHEYYIVVYSYLRELLNCYEFEVIIWYNMPYLELCQFSHLLRILKNCHGIQVMRHLKKRFFCAVSWPPDPVHLHVFAVGGESHKGLGVSRNCFWTHGRSI